MHAYANARKWKSSSVDCEASKLFKRPEIQQRYQTRLEELRKHEQESMQWTREQSIKTLREVIDQNLFELQRIVQAFDEEQDMLHQQLIQASAAGDERAAMQILQVILGRKKSKRVSTTYNNGVIMAVSELNKMQGFDESTINLNGTVVFTGQEELED